MNICPGIGPFNWFSARSSSNNGENKKEDFFSLNWPESLLLESSSISKLGRENKLCGIEPEYELKERSNIANLLSFLIEEGIFPEKLQPERLSSDKFLRLPIESGMLPKKVGMIEDQALQRTHD